MKLAGQQWVREMYEQCNASTNPPDIASCVSKRAESPLDLNKLRKHRNAEATCFQAHPGLCVCDANATSIKLCHESLRKAFNEFRLKPEDCGEALFLFCGYRRKANANRIQRRAQEEAMENVSADEFELAFLSDEPERRKGLKVFTRCHCRVDGESTFHFGCHAGLVQTEEHTLDERVGHAFTKLLRERCKYWLCFRVSYEDVTTELHVVKAFFFSFAYN